MERPVTEVYKIKDCLGKVNKELWFPLSSNIRSKDTKWNYQTTGLKQKEVLFHTLHNEIVKHIRGCLQGQNHKWVQKEIIQINGKKLRDGLNLMM